MIRDNLEYLKILEKFVTEGELPKSSEGTELPSCTYYFGPFATGNEADAAKAGYVEDLESESATGIHVSIEQRCQPTYLTIDRTGELPFGTN